MNGSSRYSVRSTLSYAMRVANQLPNTRYFALTTENTFIPGKMRYSDGNLPAVAVIICCIAIFDLFFFKAYHIRDYDNRQCYFVFIINFTCEMLTIVMLTNPFVLLPKFKQRQLQASTTLLREYVISLLCDLVAYQVSQHSALLRDLVMS